eukprot:Pgem_evm1s8740
MKQEYIIISVGIGVVGETGLTVKDFNELNKLVDSLSKVIANRICIDPSDLDLDSDPDPPDADADADADADPDPKDQNNENDDDDKEETEEPNNNNNDQQIAIIAGSTIGAIAVVGACIGVVLLYKQKSGKKEAEYCGNEYNRWRGNGVLNNNPMYVSDTDRRFNLLAEDLEGELIQEV